MTRWDRSQVHVTQRRKEASTEHFRSTNSASFFALLRLCVRFARFVTIMGRFMKTTCRKNVVIVGILMLSVGGASSAGELDPNELPSRVRSILVAKCSECHGRGLARPNAALYLHELGPLAANPEWVIPLEPEKSYLWTLIRDDDMPAKGAKAGPLNAQEKEIIRAWIAAGAPVPKSSPLPLSSAYSPQESTGARTLRAGTGGTFHDDSLIRMVRQISRPCDSFSHRTLGGGGARGSPRRISRLMDPIADGAFLSLSGSGQCHGGNGAGLAPRRCRWLRRRK